jgi:hypothetical protein
VLEYRDGDNSLESLSKKMGDPTEIFAKHVNSLKGHTLLFSPHKEAIQRISKLFTRDRKDLVINELDILSPACGTSQPASKWRDCMGERISISGLKVDAKKHGRVGFCA